MELRKYELPVEKLRWECDPSLFKFECTKDIPSLREFIGQDRAIKALEFGLNMPHSGYNIYLAGLTGTGKTSILKTYIERLVADKKARGESFALYDWCYLYNFRETDCPQIVSLPPGKGRRLQDQISGLLLRVRQELNTSFSSDEYKSLMQKTIEEGKSQLQRVYRQMTRKARQRDFALQITPVGLILTPMSDKTSKELRSLTPFGGKRGQQIEAQQTELSKKLEVSLERAKNTQLQIAEQLQITDRNISKLTISPLFEPLLDEYADSVRIKQYLTDLENYVLDNVGLLKSPDGIINQGSKTLDSQTIGSRDPFLPFQVNVFIENSQSNSPPMIVEPNPNFSNMFGKIGRCSFLNGYLSDHTMLKPGAIHRANGGYLLVNAEDVLANQGVWPALKRALKNMEIRIEDPFEQSRLIPPQRLGPEPMPLKVKIIMIGDARHYHKLSVQDDDFWEIFKVKADFNHEMEKTNRNMLDYAAFIAGCCEECKTRHLDPGAVAKLIEYSVRLVADKERLSTRFSQIKELIEEANYWASRDQTRYVTAKHIQRAIDEKLFRHNLPEERIRDMINRGTTMIDVQGEVIGQVNSLSIYNMGDITFGKPTRITAKTYIGRRGVINIERDSNLSGPIHNKGVMILGGYLGSKYAQDKPLSLSASLCFEQSYEGVEGDSASSAELYAILSSLSEKPIKQNIAVTGSMNQKGEIQSIHGINHKIEGFFRLCCAQGLTGDQGVLMPHQNLRNLMLREEVVEAVHCGQFHIYAARTVGEGIEILTDTNAGEQQNDGTYPEGTINFLVDSKLKNMARVLKGFYPEDTKVTSPYST